MQFGRINFESLTFRQVFKFFEDFGNFNLLLAAWHDHQNLFEKLFIPWLVPASFLNSFNLKYSVSSCFPISIAVSSWRFFSCIVRAFFVLCFLFRVAFGQLTELWHSLLKLSPLRIFLSKLAISIQQLFFEHLPFFFLPRLR